MHIKTLLTVGLLCLFGFPGHAQSASQVRQAVERHFSNPKNAEITPAAFHREDRFNSYINMMWELSKAVDKHEPLDDLQKYGVNVVREGVIRVDQVNHPEWIGLHDRLVPLATPGVINLVREELLFKGFQESDLNTLRTFVENNEVGERQILPKLLPLAVAVEKKVRKNRAAGLDNADVLEQFRWQGYKLVKMNQFRWSLALLKNLDKQRQRILISVMTHPEGPMTISASDRDARIRKLEAQIASGEYVAELKNRISQE